MRIKPPKQQNLVRGAKIKCPNYRMCPLCYGCRAFDNRDSECLECKKEDAKWNICNTELHEAWKINKMISKNKIKIDEEVVFVSAK